MTLIKPNSDWARVVLCLLCPSPPQARKPTSRDGSVQGRGRHVIGKSNGPNLSLRSGSTNSSPRSGGGSNPTLDFPFPFPLFCLENPDTLPPRPEAGAGSVFCAPVDGSPLACIVKRIIFS